MSFLSQPLSLISIRPKRNFASFSGYVTITEHTNDVLTITKQPVQTGAAITDHSYKEPVTFSASLLFRDNGTVLSSTNAGGNNLSLADTYQNLIDLQETRVPFDVITPKRVYESMLISVLSQTTDKYTENCLAINITFQQVVFVTVSVVTVPRINQANPAKTAATQSTGPRNSLMYNAAHGGG